MDSKTTYLTSIPGGDSFLGERGPTEESLLFTVLPYVLMIIIFPLTAFFISKTFVFQDILGYSETSANVGSAIFSIVLLHILLVIFIYKAYTDTQKKGEKQD
ncbi:vacuolar ATPase assembly integral membrane protein VMA21 homolog [Oratosquilla oratoria]|uniref:vacuolar ATPase assembly integral membrane protein VMA21 homolog n=1 Tax=Oratosquilla oratoria TaxID=337810 RepID=UPI003F76BE1D